MEFQNIFDHFAKQLELPIIEEAEKNKLNFKFGKLTHYMILRLTSKQTKDLKINN